MSSFLQLPSNSVHSLFPTVQNIKHHIYSLLQLQLPRSETGIHPSLLSQPSAYLKLFDQLKRMQKLLSGYMKARQTEIKMERSRSVGRVGFGMYSGGGWRKAKPDLLTPTQAIDEPRHNVQETIKISKNFINKTDRTKTKEESYRNKEINMQNNQQESCHLIEDNQKTLEITFKNGAMVGSLTDLQDAIPSTNKILVNDYSFEQTFINQVAFSSTNKSLASVNPQPSVRPRLHAKPQLDSTNGSLPKMPRTERSLKQIMRRNEECIGMIRQLSQIIKQKADVTKIKRKNRLEKH